MTTNRNLKVYFPNLNGLRFIAALLVIINHVEQLKLYYGFGTYPISPFAKQIGKLGVMLFFVLSGFLITFLLLSEEQKTSAIQTKKFYLRRFLRIVPLYVLIIILTYFVLYYIPVFKIPRMPNPIEDHYFITLGLHLVFLPNLITAMYGFLPYIAQAWSIGTEEQSYLLWPVLLKKFQKNRLKLMLGIILFYLGIRFTISMVSKMGYDLTILGRFWTHFNIDAIAIGGFFAVLLFQKHKILRWLYQPALFYGITIVTIGMLIMAVRIPYFHYLGYSILFGIIILNLASNSKLKKTFLEWKALNYLGRISYGIYMYHFIIMILVLVLAKKYGINSSSFIYLLTVGGTLIVSMSSYRYFEKIFLKIKTRFTIIQSGGSKF